MVRARSWITPSGMLHWQSLVSRHFSQFLVIFWSKKSFFGQRIPYKPFFFTIFGLKSRFFEVLPKRVFYWEKKILWRIELCDKCSKVVCSCQKYYALIYAMFEAFKSIFFPAKKKRRFTLFRQPVFFPAKKRRIFGIPTASTSLHVTPRHV